MSNLKINPEYAGLVSPMSDADYQTLKESIENHGLYSPIVINARDEILDGHNRYRACQELGIEPMTEVKFFDDKEEEKIFVIEANLKRRQLSDIERIQLVHDKLEPLERALAKKRQLASLNVGNIGPLAPLISNDNNGEAKGRVNEIMAEKADVSPTTYHRVATVLEEAPEEIKEKMKSGEISPSKAYNSIRASKEPRKPRTAKDFLILPALLFDSITEAIEDAREKGEPNIKLLHDRHSVVGTSAVEVAVS